MWYIHTVEYHIKEIMTQAITWINLDYTIKWNKSVTKGQICDDSIYMKLPEESSAKEQEVEWWMPGVSGWEEQELMFSGYSVSVWDNGRFGDGWCWWLHSTVNVLNVTELYI